MNLMHKHVCYFTVFDHRNTQNYESDEHAGKHCGITLIKWIFANQIVQDAHGDQVLQIKLEHAPPFGFVIVH